MQDLSHSSLIARCIDGERLAWDDFVERFSQLIYWAIKERLKRTAFHYNQQDLEDIFQNVFCLLWEKDKLRQIKDRTDVSGWLVMVAANCTYNFFRRKREMPLKQVCLSEESAPSDYSIAKIINQEELSNAIEQIFEALTAHEHIVLKLNYLYRKTHQDIAKILKMPISTVSSIAKRSKERIKEQLKKQGWDISI